MYSDDSQNDKPTVCAASLVPPNVTDAIPPTSSPKSNVRPLPDPLMRIGWPERAPASAPVTVPWTLTAIGVSVRVDGA